MKEMYLFFMSVFIAGSLLGCASEKYGAGVDRSVPEVKVKDVFLDSRAVGKKVTLQGTISSQCASNGCWFVLHDDTGQIFINLGPNNMTMPPRMNKKARVTGIVYPVQGELQIVAQGVEVR